MSAVDIIPRDQTAVRECLRDNRTWAHLLLLSSQLCFSGWHIVGSQALKEGADPFVFVLYRELVAASVMAFILYIITGERIRIDPVDYKRFFFLGCCSFVNVVGAMLSLNYISATRFAIFQPSIPCIATCISIFIGLERFTWIKAAGISLAVGGAIMAEAWNSSSSDEKNVYLGTVIVSIQVFGMANLVVFVKPILNKYHPAMITLVYYAIGTILTILLFLGFTYRFTAQDLIFHGKMLPWLGLFYAAIIATVYTYNALSWAGRHLSPSATTVYATFQPVGTIFLSFLFFAKVVTLPEGLGTVLVIAGLIVTVLGQRMEQADPLLQHKNSGDFQALLTDADTEGGPYGK